MADFSNNVQRLGANLRTRVPTEAIVTKTKAAKPAATIVGLLELPKFELPNEMIELFAAHMRTRFEAMGEQGKELAALAQKAANDTAESIKAGLFEAFKNVA